MRTIDTKKRDRVAKDVLKFLKKLNRPTTIGEINSAIGHNNYIIKKSLKQLNLKIDDKLTGGQIICLK